MTNRILFVFLVAGLMIHTAGCSLTESKDPAEAAVANNEDFAEENEADFAEVDEGYDSDDEEGADLAENGGAGGVTDGQEFPEANMDAEAETGEELSLDGSSDASAEEKDLSLDDSLPEEVASGAAPGDPPEPSLGTEPLNQAPPTDEPLFTESAESSGEPSESTPAEIAPEIATGPADATPADSTEALADSSSESSETSSSLEEISSSGPIESAPSFVPVKKIKEAAYVSGGTNINRVYLARPGDTVESVSEKIYGTDRSSDLLAWNPHLRRGLKTGDKVYYSSPRDPNDTRMLTFHEDIGAPASVYVSREGDNIRSVSKDLLGSPDSWKEVWATNMNVESKGDIPGGLELRYWPESASSAALPLANSSVPASPELADPSQGGMSAEPADEIPPPPMENMAEIPPPPEEDPFAPPGGGDMAANGQPGAAPGRQDLAASGVTAPPPEIPPSEPPPPPPPPSTPEQAESPAVAQTETETEVSALGSDPDTLMAMGFGGLLLIAAATLFVVIRKNRAKRVGLSQTQV